MGLDGYRLPTWLGRHLIVTGPGVGHWVAARVNGQFFEAASQAIGIEKDGKIIAGVIYENWNQVSIWCHIAIEGRLTKKYLWTIFDYPFKQIGAKKIIVPVSSSNEKSLRLVGKMGFVEEARIKDARPDGDMVFLVMDRENCRFLEPKYEQR
jgi:RimJ/RimL family protein N-acetyltransferase